jgi:hypothetical protein
MVLKAQKRQLKNMAKGAKDKHVSVLGTYQRRISGVIEE